MGLLPRFSTPANLPESSEADLDAWSGVVADIVRPYAQQFEQFYDPTAGDTPEGAQVSAIEWAAFPARLLRDATSEEQRWRDADSSRDEQDEYCEWGVDRDAQGKVTRVTFTTEVREYWVHLAQRDRNRLVALYTELVNPDIDPNGLFRGTSYDPRNSFNLTTVGPPAHLAQANNNLAAAVDLAARATIPRERDGQPVTSKQALVDCAGLGDPFRNSDPQIAAAVNAAARSGAQLTLADPMGLYIGGLLTERMQTPDGEDPAAFWHIERGSEEHVLRASYSVPPERGYVVGDITIEGRTIAFGAQLADLVRVRLTAVVKPGDHHPKAQPCGS